MNTNTHPLELAGKAPLVRFQNVTKRYGSLTVLDNLDLDINANEMVSIIGPSGSGKTTCLMMLAGFEPIFIANLNHTFKSIGVAKLIVLSFFF